MGPHVMSDLAAAAAADAASTTAAAAVYDATSANEIERKRKAGEVEGTDTAKRAAFAMSQVATAVTDTYPQQVVTYPAGTVTSAPSYPPLAPAAGFPQQDPAAAADPTAFLAADMAVPLTASVDETDYGAADVDADAGAAASGTDTGIVAGATDADSTAADDTSGNPALPYRATATGETKYAAGTAPGSYAPYDPTKDMHGLDSSASKADKRAHHNALERKRRDHIKDSFSVLRDSIPSLQGEKVGEKNKSSRAQILNKATEYIVTMRAKNRSHQEEMERLKKENDELDAQTPQPVDGGL